MEYNNDNSREPWEWQGDDYYLPKDANLDISECLWDEINGTGENFSDLFDETTPIKACGDLAYHVTNSEKESKEPEDFRETSSQVKRRRMLQFNSQAIDRSLCSGEISCAFLKSKEMEDSIEDVLPEASQWVSGFPDETSGSGYEGLDPSSEGWLAECLNDAEMHLNADGVYQSGVADVQADISEYSNIVPEFEANMVQGRATRSTCNVIFKGRKSYVRASTKLASSVAYPFAIIKPSEAHGDVTLKDINQWIRSPPPSKSKQSKEDPSASYPTSAFSGKPVVGKTKIRTEGGKGSITIMRTRG